MHGRHSAMTDLHIIPLKTRYALIAQPQGDDRSFGNVRQGRADGVD